MKVQDSFMESRDFDGYFGPKSPGIFSRCRTSQRGSEWILQSRESGTHSEVQQIDEGVRYYENLRGNGRQKAD